MTPEPTVKCRQSIKICCEKYTMQTALYVIFLVMFPDLLKG